MAENRLQKIISTSGLMSRRAAEKLIVDGKVFVNGYKASLGDKADLDLDEFTYVSLDVNGLKVINDTKGHTAGDELIIGACQCMKKSLGPYGKLYRIGGD